MEKDWKSRVEKTQMQSSTLWHAVIWGLGAAFLGASTGVVVGAIKDQKVKAVKSVAALALPDSVAGVPDLAQPLVTLAAGARTFDETSFRELTKKVHLMLLAASWLSGANPSAVEPALRHLGAEFAAKVKERLEKFYHASAILIVRVQQEPDHKWTKGFVPLNKDLREAHDMFCLMLDIIAEDMAMTALAKLRLGAVENRT
jgi:hypothetical protein